MKRKRDVCLIIHIIVVYIAFYIVTDNLDKDNFAVVISLLYLGCSFGLYFYSNEKEKESNKTEISELHKTVRQLEHLRKSDKQTIELLKKEQENNNNFQNIK